MTFSPNGIYLAIGVCSYIQLWILSTITSKFNSLNLTKTFGGHHSDIQNLQWSSDSQFLLSSSKDLTSRLYNLKPMIDWIPISLKGHRDYVIGAYFGQQKRIYTISRDTYLLIWKVSTSSEERELNKDRDVFTYGRIIRERKERLSLNPAKIISTSFHSEKNANLLVVGFSNGIFSLYHLPDIQLIHSLTISNTKITSCALNSTGEWLAFGISHLGQLLIWDWQSERYILKQQGHFSNIRCVESSPDGQFMVSGGDDGKVKLWNQDTGFCFITFIDHIAPVTGIRVSFTGTVVVSCSLDGTVRAFDLLRYQNFRIFTPPRYCQFLSIAIDPSEEIICAGSQDPFEIYVWSLRRYKLLDVLEGHEGPVVSLAFSSKGMLLSSSWDNSTRVWNIFNKNKSIEILTDNFQILCVCFRPDGKEFCTVSSKGQLRFWNIENGNEVGFIEATEDICGGRSVNDARSSYNSTLNKLITTAIYTPDGTCILAAGTTKFIVMYYISNKILLKKFQLSRNWNLQGVLDKLNSKNNSEIGYISSDETMSNCDEIEKNDKMKHSIRCWNLSFSPTGESFIAASTEGLILYRKTSIQFHPMELDLDSNPQYIKKMLRECQYSKALVISLRLNDNKLINEIIMKIPFQDLPLVILSIPMNLLFRLMMSLSLLFKNSPRWLEHYLRWVRILFTFHGKYMKQHLNLYSIALRRLKKYIESQYDNISKITNENFYSLLYLSSSHGTKYFLKRQEKKKIESFKIKSFRRRKDMLEEMRKLIG